MARHYFHLTNGEDLIVDREGARTRSRADVWLRARKVSDALIANTPGHQAWSDWIVCVHDAAGRQVSVIPVLGPAGVPDAPRAIVRFSTARRSDDAEGSHAHL